MRGAGRSAAGVQCGRKGVTGGGGKSDGEESRGASRMFDGAGQPMRGGTRPV